MIFRNSDPSSLKVSIIPPGKPHRSAEVLAEGVTDLALIVRERNDDYESAL